MVFLTGITATSELARNGYAANRAHFFIEAVINTYQTYNINLRITDGDNIMTIQYLDLTVIYYHTDRIANSYQMNSGVVPVLNFGGTEAKAEQSFPLDILPYIPEVYEKKINFFYGITRIIC